MIKRSIGKISAAACCMLLLSLAGAVCASAGTDGQADGEQQTGAGGKEAQRLVIQEPGTYTLTGSMKGTVYVDPGEGNVTLILDNADIEGVSEPAIMAVSGDSLTVELTDCSYNRVADTEENAEEAAILSCVDTVFRGCGCLQTEGNRRYGIRTEDADLTFSCGKYLFLSEDTGIILDGPDEGTLYLNGGCVFVNAGKEPHVAAEHIVKNAGMLEDTEKTDVRKIDCCREGDCRGCCCDKKCRRPVTVTDDDDDDDDDECDCRESEVDSPGPIAEGTVSNEAVSLEEDDQAVTIVFEGDEQHVDVTEPGTYRVTGSCADGSLTVVKDTKGVILILGDLDLTSLSGAALRVNSFAVVKIRIDGNVSLTNTKASDDAAASEGAAVIGEAGSEVCITGDGTLKIDGKTGDGIAMDEGSSLVIDGGLDMQIQAEADGIHSEHDTAILSGNVTVEAGNCGVHAGDILTIGEQDGNGPDLQVTGCREGIEADVINIKSGKVSLTASEDGIDAEKTDGTENVSVNMTGGELNIQAGQTGIDSDGNVNLIEGTAVIDSHSEDGTCQCIDEEGDLYIADDFTLDCGCEEE